jgi:tetratricopeptide (TPR) repeat protein
MKSFWLVVLFLLAGISPLCGRTNEDAAIEKQFAELARRTDEAIVSRDANVRQQAVAEYGSFLKTHPDVRAKASAQQMMDYLNRKASYSALVGDRAGLKDAQKETDAFLETQPNIRDVLREGHEVDERFRALKARGDDQLKRGMYLDAIRSYDEALKAVEAMLVESTRRGYMTDVAMSKGEAFAGLAETQFQEALKTAGTTWQGQEVKMRIEASINRLKNRCEAAVAATTNASGKVKSPDTVKTDAVK